MSANLNMWDIRAGDTLEYLLPNSQAVKVYVDCINRQYNQYWIHASGMDNNCQYVGNSAQFQYPDYL